MSHARIHDLLLLLAGGLLAAGCTEREPNPNGSGDEGVDGADPDPDADVLDAALEACKPYARKASACYSDAYGDGYSYGYVGQVGSCVAQIGYYAAESPDCADAFIDYFACLGALDCDAFLGDGDEGAEPSGPHPCDPAGAALETECDFDDDDDDSEPGNPGSDT